LNHLVWVPLKCILIENNFLGSYFIRLCFELFKYIPCTVSDCWGQNLNASLLFCVCWLWVDSLSRCDYWLCILLWCKDIFGCCFPLWTRTSWKSGTFHLTYLFCQLKEENWRYEHKCIRRNGGRARQGHHVGSHVWQRKLNLTIYGTQMLPIHLSIVADFFLCYT
jgi:hypothetical protein